MGGMIQVLRANSPYIEEQEQYHVEMQYRTKEK